MSLISHTLSSLVAPIVVAGGAAVLPPKPADPPKPLSRPKRLRATHTFNPTSPKMLFLEAGDEITFVEEKDSNWWRCRTVDGRVGLAPTNYLQELPPTKFCAIASFAGTSTLT